MTCESPERMRARAQRKGYQNGTQFGSLESQVIYDPKIGSLLKTPCAMAACADKRKSKSVSGTSGTLAQEIASGYVRKRGLMLPTPLAVEVNHSRRVKELKATGATSFHSRANGESRPNSLMDYLEFHEVLPDSSQMTLNQKKGGHTFRLSPLFTEEMMGFPLMWTTYPFLLQSGGQNR